MIHRIHLRILADYHQFYVWDPQASERMAPDTWSDENMADRMNATDHVFVVSPIRNMEVPFTLEVHERNPTFHMAEWNHIVEAPIDVPSGKIEVHECTGGPHAKISVEPGKYQIRALYKGLDTISEDQTKGKDSYLLTIWRDDSAKFKVLKRYSQKA